MKIAATVMSMDAAHTYTEVAFQPTTFSPNLTPPQATEQSKNFGSRLSSLLDTGSPPTRQSEIEIEPAAQRASLINQPPLQADNQTLAQMTGKIIGHSVSVRNVATTMSLGLNSAHETNRRFTQAKFNGVRVYYEKETMQFSASGSVRTSEGADITFQFGLEMNRQQSIVTTSGRTGLPYLIDPLVLNFSEDASIVGDSYFTFDLDGDGGQEKLSCLGQGCGFLAFDRNQDGQINNGLELFGPATGSGFGELGELDQDDNLWIDENDPIYEQLSVWMKDGNGDNQLLSLKEVGVGAISIANAGSEFTLQDAQGDVVGQVKGNGIFLTEHGEVRSLQEVDLADMNNTTSESENRSRLDLSSPILQSIHELRDIIEWQQFRLKLLLSKKRSEHDILQFFNRHHSRFPDHLDID